ncbi:hypothetical protein [Geminicoccus harenae]|uniref:hypothetical protein n=1 Tax=Geminicoccus harenae TaxID=2498453 RepID=UPI00168AD7AD|nr:hypothetical protein [Geminicoccus harenae]
MQRQGKVIHLVAERPEDLSRLVASLGSRSPPGYKPRDIYIRELRLSSGIKLPTRDFR